jgi:hypothetical protein
MKAAPRWLAALLVFGSLGIAVNAQTPPPAPSSPPTPAPAAPTSAAEPPPPAPAVQEPTQSIGGEVKLAMGKVIDMEKQDNGCLLNFTHRLRDKMQEAVELGVPELCARKPSLKGQTLHFVYKMQKVLADECVGNPRCKKTEERAIIVEANALK